MDAEGTVAIVTELISDEEQLLGTEWEERESSRQFAVDSKNRAMCKVSIAKYSELSTFH